MVILMNYKYFIEYFAFHYHEAKCRNTLTLELVHDIGHQL